jgi:hypothetical protein
MAGYDLEATWHHPIRDTTLHEGICFSDVDVERVMNVTPEPGYPRSELGLSVVSVKWSAIRGRRSYTMRRMSRGRSRKRNVSSVG